MKDKFTRVQEIKSEWEAIDKLLLNSIAGIVTLTKDPDIRRHVATLIEAHKRFRVLAEKVAGEL